MRSVVFAIHVFLTLALIGVILLQKGEDISSGPSAFSGYNIRGTGNFLTRATAILGSLFFTTSLFLAVLTRREAENYSIVKLADQPAPGSVAAPKQEEKTQDISEKPPADFHQEQTVVLEKTKENKASQSQSLSLQKTYTGSAVQHKTSAPSKKPSDKPLTSASKNTGSSKNIVVSKKNSDVRTIKGSKKTVAFNKKKIK
jgi:preprotein translocase subunit SecG